MSTRGVADGHQQRNPDRQLAARFGIAEICQRHTEELDPFQIHCHHRPKTNRGWSSLDRRAGGYVASLAVRDIQAVDRVWW